MDTLAPGIPWWEGVIPAEGRILAESGVGAPILNPLFLGVSCG